MSFCNPFLQFNFASMFAFGNSLGNYCRQAFFADAWGDCGWSNSGNCTSPGFYPAQSYGGASIFNNGVNWQTQSFGAYTGGLDTFTYSGSGWNCDTFDNSWNYYNGTFNQTTSLYSFVPSSTSNKTKKTSDTGSGGVKGGTSVTVEGGVKDGTSVTVEGVDYSVFDKPNEIKKLRPEMQRKLELVYKYAKEKGYNLTLNSGFRSTERQKKLYDAYLARGKKPPTVAKPGTSRHEFGCAVDLQIDGSSNSDKLLDLGKYASSIGLRQGLSFGERWHFDMDPKKTPKSVSA